MWCKYSIVSYSVLDIIIHFISNTIRTCQHGFDVFYIIDYNHKFSSEPNSYRFLDMFERLKYAVDRIDIFYTTKHGQFD